MIFKTPHVRRLDKLGGKWQGVLSYKDGTGWHTMTKVLGDPGMSEKAANEALMDWQLELEKELDGKLPDSSMKVADYCDRYVDTLEKTGAVERSTIRDYRHSASRVRRGLAAVKMCDLKAAKVQAWEEGLLDQGLSPSTVIKTHRFLKQVCKHAVEVDDLTKNPLSAVKPPKRPRSRPNALDRDGVVRLLTNFRALAPTPVTVGAIVALMTGMREGELCALRWSSVDFEAREIRVVEAVGVADGGSYLKETKTSGSQRTIPFGDDVKDILVDWAARCRQECMRMGVPFTRQHFVLGTYDGGRMHPQRLSRGWTEMSRAMGLVGTEGRPVTFHDLRHTFATVAIAAKADVKSVSAILGHSNAAMTLNIYADALPDAKRAAVDAMGSSLATATATASLFD